MQQSRRKLASPLPPAACSRPLAPSAPVAAGLSPSDRLLGCPPAPLRCSSPAEPVFHRLHWPRHRAVVGLHRSDRSRLPSGLRGRRCHRRCWQLRWRPALGHPDGRCRRRGAGRAPPLGALAGRMREAGARPHERPGRPAAARRRAPPAARTESCHLRRRKKRLRWVYPAGVIASPCPELLFMRPTSPAQSGLIHMKCTSPLIYGSSQACQISSSPSASMAQPSGLMHCKTPASLRDPTNSGHAHNCVRRRQQQ